jgi:hypothetical protein
VAVVRSDDLDEDPRLARQRREYRSSPVFQIGLWAEEHSAQLALRENRRLQDLFKAGIRNVLSATTTLELGIGGSAAKERRQRGHVYWTAYWRVGGRLRKVYGV